MSRRGATLPYESATAGAQALAEVQKVLGKLGCSSFGHYIDAEKGKTVVQFAYRGNRVSLEASWQGYAAAWSKVHPYSGRGSRTNYDRCAIDIAKVAVCSLLRDWIKGQITAVECGVMSFEAVFMPHVLLPTGERVVDRLTGPDGVLRITGGT